ncbi:hypothetical protein D3C72_1900970 [compost metagenome]
MNDEPVHLAFRQVGLGPQGHGAPRETLIGLIQHAHAGNRIGNAEAVHRHGKIVEGRLCGGVAPGAAIQALKQRQRLQRAERQYVLALKK